MYAQLMDCIWITLDFICGALNSNFAIAAIGGLTGAFGGALGAQRIVERNKQRNILLKELRNTNAAIMVAFSACNAALALKKQHVQPMYEQFEEALLTFKEKQNSNGQHHLVIDLRTFPTLIVPIETLKDLVFDKISAFGRQLASVSTIEQSLIGLNEAIRKRDLLIRRIESGNIPAELLPEYYFGFPLPTGDTNQEYPDLVKAIHSYVDDIAFFSALLCDDLISHGNRMQKVFTKKLGKGAPKVSATDFSVLRQNGLIPSNTQYENWLNAFTEQESNCPTLSS